MPRSSWLLPPPTAEKPATPSVGELLDFELEFQGSQFHGALIRERFGITPARYYQLLFAAIDTVTALEHDPITTRRLQRLRDRLAAERRPNAPRRDHA